MASITFTQEQRDHDNERLNQFVSDLQSWNSNLDHLLVKDYGLTSENAAFIKGLLSMHNRLPSDSKEPRITWTNIK